METVKVEMRISDIESEFSLLKEKNDSFQEVFTFNISSEVQIFDTKKQFVNNQSFDLLYENGEDILASIKVKYTYDVIDFENVVKRDNEGQFLIRGPIIDYINSISMNTSRGIIHENLKNTYLNKALLPLLSLPKMPMKES